MEFAIGFVLALAISGAALAARSLSQSGAVAAVVLGTLIYGLGGWQAAIVLLAFFVSSSLIERLVRPMAGQPSGLYAKGGQRDAGQVLGNGLVAAVFALVARFYPGMIWPWLGFAGSLAAVTADTWATELGVLSSMPPRLITRIHQRVRPGTSGGVSIPGSLAAVLGSALIGMLGALLAPDHDMRVALSVLTGGIIGAFLDSYLGATVQGMYFCDTERVETEQHPFHRCGSRTVHVRGWSWLNNDLVNFACGASGAVTACLVALAFGAL